MTKITFTQEQFDRALHLYNNGLSQTAVADQMGVSRSWLRNLFVEKEVKLRRKWAKNWRRCRGCNKHLEVNNENFYHGKDYLCKDCSKKKQLHIHREKEFGITSNEYLRMLNAQNGVCAICGGTNEDAELAVDHNHITGDVRGLLCRNCNTGLGMFQDNPEVIENALDYLRSRDFQQQKN